MALQHMAVDGIAYPCRNADILLFRIFFAQEAQIIWLISRDRVLTSPSGSTVLLRPSSLALSWL